MQNSLRNLRLFLPQWGMDKLNRLIHEQSALIAKLEATAAAVEQELKLAHAKMAGLREASRAIGQEPEDAPISIEPKVDLPLWLGTIPLKTANDKIARRKRPLQEQWKSILQYIGESGKAKLDEVCQAFPLLKRKNISSQLAYYEKQEYVFYEPIKETYFLTESGKVACGFL